jgi:hypothetical protein
MDPCVAARSAQTDVTYEKQEHQSDERKGLFKERNNQSQNERAYDCKNVWNTASKGFKASFDHPQV